MILAINRDTRLNPGERVALVGAVGHADNTSRKVCFSQKALAEELNVSRDTVKRAFNKAMTLGYFTQKHPWRNERGHMMTDYFFASQPPVVHEKSRPVVEPVVHEKSPSTTSTTTPSPYRHPDADKAPPFWDDLDEGSETPGEEPATETKPCGCMTAQVCPDCRPTPKVVSKRPEHEQRQFHEQQNEAEGLNPLGYYDGEPAAPAAPGYRSRSRN